MKKEVTYQLKCMMCENISSYIMRSKNSETMSDADVYSMISDHAQSPFTQQYCEKDKQRTLQMRVGWDF